MSEISTAEKVKPDFTDSISSGNRNFKELLFLSFLSGKKIPNDLRI
jgi:hypothetical protein